MLTCCSLPRVSVKRRSAHFTSFSLISLTTSLELIPPPLVDRSSWNRSHALDGVHCTDRANPVPLKSSIYSATWQITGEPPAGYCTSIVRRKNQCSNSVQPFWGNCREGILRWPLAY